MTLYHRLHSNLSYQTLPSLFYSKTSLTPTLCPKLIAWNEPVAQQLGLHQLNIDQIQQIFSGNQKLENSEYLALAYAGHQFGHFVPQLGDGRAVLLGTFLDTNGQPFDIQLKGSGPTEFSRGGDGRSPLGPVLREYLISQAMEAFNIPTTRALAAIATGQSIQRHQLSPGGVLTRVAKSHIRIGTFEYAAVYGGTNMVKKLADYVIERHFPDLRHTSAPYQALLEKIISLQANLIAKWMSVGFIHGVMNTDNSAISGETLDYGPCAFMDEYHPETVFSSIDRFGRYRYENQPHIAQWNLGRLAEALMDLLGTTSTEGITIANTLLAEFQPQYQQAWYHLMLQKIGLQDQCVDNHTLVDDLLTLMQQTQSDFTNTFIGLTHWLDPEKNHQPWLNGLLLTHPQWHDWLARWQTQLSKQTISQHRLLAQLRQTNPVMIPRNHLVEQAIDAAEHDANFEPFNKLLKAVTNPYQIPVQQAYTMPPTDKQKIRRTFCGT